MKFHTANIHGARFGRKIPSFVMDRRTTHLSADGNAVATDDFAPKQIQGSQVFRRPATASQRTHTNDEMEQLRAEIRRKEELIQRLKADMQFREHRSKAREERVKAELDQKVAAARQQAEQDRIELEEDLQVSRSLQEDLRVKNNVLKAENREQRKALSDYHVLYSLNKAYGTLHKKLGWPKRLEAERLYDKYKKADTDAMKAAYELYGFLEDNGLEKTCRLDPDLKRTLKWAVNKNERPSG